MSNVNEGIILDHNLCNGCDHLKSSMFNFDVFWCRVYKEEIELQSDGHCPRPYRCTGKLIKHIITTRAGDEL